MSRARERGARPGNARPQLFGIAANKEMINYVHDSTKVIGFEKLLANKMAVGRPQDLADVERLHQREE